MKLLSIVFISVMPFLAQSQPEAYRIYNAEGKTVKWEKMINTLAEQQIVFFGELHNNAISHWLQLELTQELFEQKTTSLALGAEMFETDNQLLLDEYFNDYISQKNFEEEVRLWNNYQTDYKPLVEFAKTNQLPFIATNIPRRYAAMVNKKGFESLDSLTDESKKYLPPLPVPFNIELPGYANILKMGAHMPGKKTNAENLVKAQALKDATMAHSISKNLHEKTLILHFNGSYHSDNHEGIVWYINEYIPGTKTKTISTVLQKDIKKMNDEHKNVADYIIVVNENVTNTY